ncbi:plasmid partitioning protein RepB [Stagnihabitans tardus]|uniref:Plasmid partitioning protein RepB n=1 Tax=Stagnihabitans tardus TaxID=2699202 RepID=A0AAE4YFE3_9RHOB|nr:plasmid partitioning protein RepB [Stagnihabitans tardus]NBZ89219.1 plasmid partitioning protein RepB [Stagnihabitans tardus]
MARKVFGDSLKSAMRQGLEEPAEVTRSSPTVARAQASVLEEDKHATRLLDPGSIRMSAVMDRIDPAEGLDDLVASIREHGQKVPILVRRIPDGYEIVYGRRRLLACRALGQRVRATVMEMTEEEAIIAQGVENNARLDPSFIERALFVAGIIRELGKTEEGRGNAQTVAYRALQIDESLVSRMNRIANSIPIELIRAIGPAYGVGRRIWEKLAKLCEANPKTASAVAAQVPQGLASPDRLNAAIIFLSPPSDPPRKSADGVKMTRKGNRIILEVEAAILPQIEATIERAIRAFLYDDPAS